jgi:hypothetical protein
MVTVGWAWWETNHGPGLLYEYCVAGCEAAAGADIGSTTGCA